MAPVGTLVGPLQPSSASRAAAAPPTRAAVVAGSHPAAGLSVLAAVGFSFAAVLIALLGFACNRRHGRTARSGSPRSGA